MYYHAWRHAASAVFPSAHACGQCCVANGVLPLSHAAAKRVKAQQHHHASFRETTAEKFSNATAERHIATSRKVAVFSVRLLLLARHF